jgi:hypothetical protein
VTSRAEACWRRALTRPRLPVHQGDHVVGRHRAAVVDVGGIDVVTGCVRPPGANEFWHGSRGQGELGEVIHLPKCPREMQVLSSHAKDGL